MRLGMRLGVHLGVRLGVRLVGVRLRVLRGGLGRGAGLVVQAVVLLVELPRLVVLLLLLLLLLWVGVGVGLRLGVVVRRYGVAVLGLHLEVELAQI